MRILGLKLVKNIEYFLFGVILLFGLIFAFIIPPFQKPDENMHFLRAVALSKGEFFCHSDENGNKSFTIPLKYSDYITEVGTNRIAFNYNEKFNIDSILKVEKSQQENTGDFELKGYCTLPSFSYLPAAVAVLIGELLSSVSLSFYLGRFVSFLTLYVFLIWSYKKIRKSNLRWVIIAFGLIPMVTHQASAIGYDFLQLAIIPIIFALVISSIESKNFDKKDQIYFFTSMVLLLLAKPGYYFMSLIFFLIPKDKVSRDKKKYIIFSIIYFVACLLIAISFASIYRGTGVFGEGISPIEQLKNLSNPIFFILLIRNTITGSLLFYLQSFIGWFGWLDYSLSMTVYLLYFVSWAVLIGKIKNETFFNKLYSRTFLLGLVIIMTTGFIFGSIYLTWNVVGSTTISGVQGRYFLVLFPFIILFLAGLFKVIESKKILQYIFVILMSLYLILEISYGIYKRYYDYSFGTDDTYVNMQEKLISAKVSE